MMGRTSLSNVTLEEGAAASAAVPRMKIAAPDRIMRWRLACKRLYHSEIGLHARSRVGDQRDGGGGSVPPSANVFMFWSACVKRVLRCARSFARAASSGSCELSKIKVYTSLDVVAVTGRASSVP